VPIWVDGGPLGGVALVAHDVDHFVLVILDDDPPRDAVVDDHFDCRLVDLRARLVSWHDGVAPRFMPSEPNWNSGDKRILFKTADGQFLDAQNKRGALAISPA